MYSSRRVQFPGDTTFDVYTEFQINYMNYLTGCLIPNTEVRVGDERWMQVNSLGCKGEELDPGLGTIGFFGDSATFGMALSRHAADRWPFHARIHGYQALNAAVEGHCFERISARYAELSARVDLAAVVVGGTWHNLAYNESGEQAWASFLARFEGARVLAICTLATSLVPESCERGLDDLIAGRAGRTPFLPWGDWPATAAKTREAYEAVLRYNAFVRRYCRRTGAVLIDLFNAYRPASYEEMPDMFRDPAHALPDLYPRLGRCVREALATYLPAGVTDPASDIDLALAVESQQANPNVYPLW